MKYLILASSILTGAIGQVAFKWGINRETGAGMEFYLSLVKNPGIYIGFFSYGISFLLWMYVLRSFELSYARPLTSLGYIITYILTIFFLGEPFLIKRVLGILLIITGVMLLQ